MKGEKVAELIEPTKVGKYNAFRAGPTTLELNEDANPTRALIIIIVLAILVAIVSAISSAGTSG